MMEALRCQPGAVSIEDAVDAVSRLEKNGTLHAANTPVPGDSLTTDKAVADEKETIALMLGGRGAMPLRGRAVDKALRNGPLTDGQKEAVKVILSEKDRVIGVQGYAGTGKTTMLKRARALLEKRGFEIRGLTPCASAAQTLAAECGIESETLQRFLARNAGVAEGRLTRKGAESGSHCSRRWESRQELSGKKAIEVSGLRLKSAAHPMAGRTIRIRNRWSRKSSPASERSTGRTPASVSPRRARPTSNTWWPCPKPTIAGCAWRALRRRPGLHATC